MKRVAFLLAACAAAPSLAHAEPIVDQVERLDVERGENEWELQSVYARAANGEASELVANFSAEFGLSDRLALGFELETGRSGSEGLDAELFALQAKYIAIDPRTAPIGLGAQLSLGRAFHGDETELELRLLAETRFAGLALAGDVAMEHALAGDEPHDVAVRYAARLDWRRPWGVLALEAGGDWGALDDLHWSDEGRHWLGPVLGLDVSERLSIQGGYFIGLSEATPDAQFRIEIALR